MKKIKVLFVCLGNICRSPAAEAIAQHQIDNDTHLRDHIEVDSAGLHNYHEGGPADARMQEAAAKRGYDVTSISRPITYDDFEHFDYIVAMDDSNAQELYNRAPTLEASRKIVKMANYFPEGETLDYVPDPYYGGHDGFTLVLDLLEASIHRLLDEVAPKRAE